MIRIAAAGDFHAGPESKGTLAPLLTGLREEADLFLVAGDLTRDGKPEEAAIVAAELADVGVPVIAVLGNHDYDAGQAAEITAILQDGGIQVLDRNSVVLNVDGQRVAIAGTKGFGGGFGSALAEDVGEPEMKAWVRHAETEAEALENILGGLVGDARIVLLHYAPTPDTLNGERLELYPFLGNSMLGEAIDRAGADLVLHGHAHHGSLAGTTASGVPVRNVAQPVIRRPYAVFTIERGDEIEPALKFPIRRGRRDDRGRGDRKRQGRSPRWWRRRLSGETNEAASTRQNGESR